MNRKLCRLTSMTVTRVIPLCFVIFSVFHSRASAQTNDMSGSIPGYGNPIVSIHALSIPNEARAYYNKGVRRLNAKDFNGSISDFQRAIRVCPTFYEAYNLLGEAELAMQNWDDAEAAFRKSLELSASNFAAPHFGLGLVLSHRKRFADAESMIRDGLELNPADPSGNFCLGWVLYLTGRFSEAEQSTHEAIVRKPTALEPYLLLAQIHSFQHNSAAEIKDLESYLKLDPSSARSVRARAALEEARRATTGTNGNVGEQRTSEQPMER